ncbi:hypothetical protein PENTCL1PPCAC_19762, partial [Pristionchus entomophagus]
FQCGGVGPCNIFCCNCDGGCWLAHFVVPLLEQLIPADISSLESRHFSAVDANGDGVISEVEGEAYMNSTKSIRNKRDTKWFAEMDTNGDGVIQPGEFDKSLA